MKSNLLTLILGFVSIFCFAQEHQNKTALVIGNTNYQVGKLRNPVNDARALSETLTNLGFDVITKYDLDRIQLRTAVREFGNAIRSKEGIAFFYYSGHGLQSEGVNYLVPVDADIQEEYEIKDQCVSADQVLRMLNAYKNPFNIIVLDACRNNPYESRYRSTSRGLAQPELAPTGTIMAYSTAPGRTASDGVGDNGLYTQELIKAMNTPDLDIEGVFKQTRINVRNISGDKQIPWETSSLMGDFYFSGSSHTHETDLPAGQTGAPTSGPVLVSGKVSVDYGSILIDTRFAGDLYLDGEKLGYLQAKSTGNQLNKLKTGAHTVKIVGSETQTHQITVYKDRITTVIFETKNSLVTGILTDGRDGKGYTWVRTGSQEWIAENMDYGTPGSYVNVKGDRLYTWDAAMKACPDGWHLPSDQEWDLLVDHFGGEDEAGAALKSKTGWEYGGNGTNISGFTALPAGLRHNNGKFYNIKNLGYFWSSAEQDGDNAWFRLLDYESSEVHGNYNYKDLGLSCRCIRD